MVDSDVELSELCVRACARPATAPALSYSARTMCSSRDPVPRCSVKATAAALPTDILQQLTCESLASRRAEASADDGLEHGLGRL